MNTLLFLLQLDRVTRESAEEIAMLSSDVERSKAEAQELVLKAEMTRLQAEEEAKQQTYKLSEQLEEMQRRQEMEVCMQRNFNHNSDLCSPHELLYPRTYISRFLHCCDITRLCT